MRLYRASEYLTEDGYQILFETWKVVRETTCYYFCTKAFYVGIDNSKLKRVHKTSSKFAFATKEIALDKFIQRKKKHLKHLELNTKLMRILVDSVSERNFDESDYKHGYGDLYIPLDDTKEKVLEHVNFY